MNPHTSSGLTRRRFLRSSAGATGIALGGWRWLSLLTPAEGSLPAIAAPILGGAAGISALAVAPRSAAAQGSATAFLEFPTPASTSSGPLQIVGESQDGAHPNAIEVIQAALGAEDPQSIGAAATGAAAGKTQFHILKIVKNIDATTPQLLRLAGEGVSLPEARLSIRHAGAADDFVLYRFGLVFVTSIDITSAKFDLPREEIQLAFGSMEISNPQDPSNPRSTAAWSQVLNAPTFDVN